MEEEYLADRARLRQLLRQQPNWTKGQYAAAVGAAGEVLRSAGIKL
jgi:hypothetical protein